MMPEVWLAALLPQPAWEGAAPITVHLFLAPPTAAAGDQQPRIRVVRAQLAGTLLYPGTHTALAMDVSRRPGPHSSRLSRAAYAAALAVAEIPPITLTMPADLPIISDVDVVAACCAAGGGDQKYIAALLQWRPPPAAPPMLPAPALLRQVLPITPIPEQWVEGRVKWPPRRPCSPEFLQNDPIWAADIEARARRRRPLRSPPCQRPQAAHPATPREDTRDRHAVQAWRREALSPMNMSSRGPIGPSVWDGMMEALRRYVGYLRDTGRPERGAAALLCGEAVLDYAAFMYAGCEMEGTSAAAEIRKLRILASCEANVAPIACCPPASKCRWSLFIVKFVLSASIR
jgi:hypothetical protein